MIIDIFAGMILLLLLLAVATILWFVIWLFSSNKKHKVNYDVNYDTMTGEQFERFCASILSDNGYSNVTVTKGSGDHGVDILAFLGGQKYAIQCKRYNKNIGNKAVQEVYSGKSIYNAQIAVVITNQFFTKQAKFDANKLGVRLWDRNTLNTLITNAKKITQQQVSYQVSNDSRETLETVNEQQEKIINNSLPMIEKMGDNNELLHFMFNAESKILFQAMCKATEGEIKKCYEDPKRFDTTEFDLLYRSFVTNDIIYYSSQLCYSDKLKSYKFIYYSEMSEKGRNSKYIKELEDTYKEHYDIIVIYIYYKLSDLEFYDGRLNVLSSPEISFQPDNIDGLKMKVDSGDYPISKDSMYFLERNITMETMSRYK